MSRLGALLAGCYSVFAFYMLYDSMRYGCSGLSGISAAIGVLPAAPIFGLFQLDGGNCDLRIWTPMYLTSVLIVYGAGSLLERGGRWVAAKLTSR